MEADILMVADAAQVANDKLSVLGGGWRYLRVQKLPTVHPFAVTAGLLVDWMETNVRHAFKLDIQNEDSKRVYASVDGEFEMGRPPGIPPGSKQRVCLALNLAQQFQEDGPYLVRLLVDGRQVGSAQFFVIDMSKPAPRLGLGDEPAG